MPIRRRNVIVPRRARANANLGSLLPLRRRGSPGSCPSTARARPASRASSRRRRKYGRDSSGSSRERRHRRQAADLDRRALEERLEVRRFDARLRRLAGEVHLDERGDRQPRAADSEASECTSSQTAFTSGALRLWRCPMKCQRNASPKTRVLRAQVLRAVLADDFDARLRQRSPCPRSARTSWRRRPSPPARPRDPRRARSLSRTRGQLRSRDQLPRGRQLGVAAVELAVQLATAKLGEHLPHPRRLAQAELGEVGARDLEPDAAQAEK